MHILMGPEVAASDPEKLGPVSSYSAMWRRRSSSLIWFHRKKVLNFHIKFKVTCRRRPTSTAPGRALN